MRKIELLKPRLKRNLPGSLPLFMFLPMMIPMMFPCCHTMGAHKKHEEKPQLIGNKICPVSGQAIHEKTKATYNYKVKTYNFCCATCVDDFKKGPEKYIKKIEEDNLQVNNKQEEGPSSETHQHSH